MSPRFDLSDPDAVSFCPSCGAGFGPRTVRCQECEQELVARSTVEAELEQERREHQTGPLVKLASITDRVAVSIVKERLKEQGIPFTSREKSVLTIPFTGLPGPIEIFVAEDDLSRAQWVCHEVGQLGPPAELEADAETEEEDPSPRPDRDDR